MGFGELIRCDDGRDIVRRVSIRIAVILVLFALSGCHVYWGEEIAGRVVDSQSRKPIVGAVVAVAWDLYGGVAHGNTIGPWVIDEAVTDSEGKFRLAMWGPKVVLWNGLHVSAPILIAGHEEYYFHMLAHSHPASELVPPTFSIERRTCDCGQNEIAITRLDGDLQRYRENAELANLNLSIRPWKAGVACASTAAPGFTREMLRRSSDLTKNGIVHALPTHSC
jgi:hypothetical protein